MNGILSFLADGLSKASAWQVLGYTLLMTHVTIVAVTVFLHRSQSHRSLELHPIVMHFFRFWLWMTTGMVTKEWVAIHRKHHAKCEREGDPHSPMLFGVWRVLFRGAELYRSEAKNQETLTRYGHGTPDDWLERNVYSKYSTSGVGAMLVIDVLLFGALGLTVWAVQMAWIPFWAGGVVNGISHFFGYRNYSSPDTSTNMFPIGLVIGGEELHNNHHAYGTSAKFSQRWFELDVGWAYISILKFFGLAKIRKIAPKLKLRRSPPPEVDMQTLQGVLVHRYEVMARYGEVIQQVTQRICEKSPPEFSGATTERARVIAQRLRRLLSVNESSLKPKQVEEVERAIESSPAIHVVVSMRRKLYEIWESSSASAEDLMRDLSLWCRLAQQSGVSELETFSSRLRRYVA